MPVDISVRGADDLGRIARQLKATGDGGLRKELFAGINRATKPIRKAMQDKARSDLPQRGGLNEFVARSKLTTRARTGKNPGVRITAGKAGHDLKAIDRGRLRHPVFGRRSTWVTQSVKPGWFTKTGEAGIDDVRREVVKVVDDVARKIR